MITIYGSHGEFDADEVTGKVLAHRPDTGSDGSYAGILSIDVAEWRRAYPGQTLGDGGILDVDILDVGFWLKNGSYEEPVASSRARRRAGVEA